MTPQDAPQRQRRLLYGRRKGPKLSAHQQALRETLLPKLLLTLEKDRDPRSYFTTSLSDIWLEVGYGSGEHLLWQARANPQVGIIGAEPYISGTAKLLSKLERILPELMSLKPRNIREHLGLNKPIYARTSAYGHFGREPDAQGGFSWEKTDLADALKRAV